MFILNRFIAGSVTFRPLSMFAAVIESNRGKLAKEIKGKRFALLAGQVASDPASSKQVSVDAGNTKCKD